MSHKTPGIKHFTHLFPNTQIMQFQCDDIWRRVDQLNFRFGDELTSRPRRRDDQGDELTCNRWTDCWKYEILLILRLDKCLRLDDDPLTHSDLVVIIIYYRSSIWYNQHIYNTYPIYKTPGPRSKLPQYTDPYSHNFRLRHLLWVSLLFFT